MKEKKLIFLNITKFLGDYDFKKYELDEYKKYFQLEIHELIDIFYPKKRQEYLHIKNSHKIYNFSNLKSWMHYIENTNKHFDLYIWFQTVPLNFKAFNVYWFLKKKNIKIILTHHGTLPIEKKNFSILHQIKKIPYRIKILFSFPKQYLSWYSKILILFLIRILNFRLYPDYLLVNGLNRYKFYFKNIFYKTKLVSINAWDLSRVYRNKKIDRLIKKKYICYLSDGGPNAPGDSALLGVKREWEQERYYKDLNFFFKTIAKKFKCQVVVSAHPRTNSSFEKKYFKNNKIFYGKSMELIKYSYFTVSVGSSANNYATIFNTPILFITNSEYLKNVANIKTIKLYADVLGAKLINISNNLQLKIQYPLISKNKYKNYKLAYLTNVKKEKTPNYKIVLKEVFNLKI